MVLVVFTHISQSTRSPWAAAARARGTAIILAIWPVAGPAGAQTSPRDVAAGASASVVSAPAAGAPGAPPPTPPPSPGTASAADAAGWSLIPIVLPAYQPETSFLLGAAAVLSHQPAAGTGLRESQITFAGAASVRKQFTALLQPDLFLAGDRVHLGGTLSAARFPDTFYGVGADTPESLAEPYTADLFELEVSPRLRLMEGLYVGPSLRLQAASLAQVETGGLLSSGDIVGDSGGLTVQLGVSAFLDTRSSTLYPTRGGIVRVNLRRGVTGMGSDFGHDLLRLDARQYLTLPWHPRHVLALQGVLELREGEAPFYDLGRLGGAEIMRGYYEGRHRDRQLYAVQAEYRAHLVGRFGAVGFVSLGGVARDFDAELLEHPRLAGGGGLRLAPLADVPVNFRLDVAFGDGAAFYLNVGEAF